MTARRTALPALCLAASSSLAPALAQPAPMAAPPIHVDVSQAPAPAPGHAADDDATEIAKKLQNPIGDLISVPFNNTTNFNVGPNKGTQDNLQLQPVVPIHVNEDWNVITRTVLPFVWSPSFQPAASVPPFGVAPTTFTAFLSPRNAVDGWVWGVGPVAQFRQSATRHSARTCGVSVRPQWWLSWQDRSSRACWSTTSSRWAARRDLAEHATIRSWLSRSSTTTSAADGSSGLRRL